MFEFFVIEVHYMIPGDEVIKIILNSAEHELFLLINVKIPTSVGILTFISRKMAF